MLFNNLTVFKIDEKVDFSDILNQMSNNLFREIGRLDMEVLGWESPLPKGDLIVRDAGDLVSRGGSSFLLKLRTDTKNVPARYLKLKYAEAIKAGVRKNTGKLNKSQVEDIKESVLLDLVQKAFPVPEFTYGYVDLKNHWIVINTGTAAKAEAFISFLRQTMGSLPVYPLIGEGIDISKVLTKWVKVHGSWPDKIQVTDKKCVIENPDAEDKSKTTFDQQDLFSQGVESVLSVTGKRVTQLSVEWDEKFTFVLDKNLVFKRVKATDLNKSWKSRDIYADLAIMQGEFESMVNGLVDVIIEGE